MDRSSERGITIFELLICCGIIGLIAAIAAPIYQNAMMKARRVALAGDFHELYSSFMRYHIDYGRFPTDSGAGALVAGTLAPLSTGGYYTHAQSFNSKLQGNQVVFYWAPDWNGPDANFVIAGRSRVDPSVMVYAMHYGFGGLIDYDGVYLLVNGNFVRADGRS